MLQKKIAFSDNQWWDCLFLFGSHYYWYTYIYVAIPKYPVQLILLITDCYIMINGTVEANLCLQNLIDLCKMDHFQYFSFQRRLIPKIVHITENKCIKVLKEVIQNKFSSSLTSPVCLIIDFTYRNIL